MSSETGHPEYLDAGHSDLTEMAAAEQARAAEAEEAAAAERRAAVEEAQAQMASAAMAALQGEAEAENAAADLASESMATLIVANRQSSPIVLPEIDRVEAPRGSFGPSFWPELRADGLDTLPFVASGDHVIFSPEIQPEDRAKVIAVIEAHDPEAEPPPPLVVVSSVDFYRRMTVEEADQVEDVIAQQSARDRRIFEKANTFRSDAPEWPTLVGLATQLFGKDRAAEILAPSEV